MNQKNKSCMSCFLHTMQRKPDAAAKILGSENYHCIHGMVKFYQTAKGVLISVEIFGLPSCDDSCKGAVHGFHIHSGECCSGNEQDPFADAKMHYNPCDCEHPYHAGDLPPLFADKGYAFSVVLTDRFTVKDIIGRTVIVHSDADDFTSQPSGNSGEKIACGEIKPLCR